MGDFIIDAYAWIEYFNGSSAGEKVRTIIEDKSNSSYTNVVTIAELASYFHREKLNFEDAKKIILSLSSPYAINQEFAEEAGKLHCELKKVRKHLGLADIFVLLTAKRLAAKVITGDEDFRGLKEALMIK